MTNSNERDSLGLERTLFPSEPPQAEPKLPKRPPHDSLMQQSLNNMNTVGDQNPVNQPGIDETVFYGNDRAARAFLGEGVSLGNNYRLEKRLGRGGMGEAWKANDLMAGRNVVIKLVPPEIRNAELAMGQVRDTFLKVHALQHQHICPMMGLIDDPDHGLYVVMKFINGKTLDVYRKDYIKQHGNFPAAEAIQILWAVARALDYSHERKVLHRDVKPQNIMVSPEDGVQLIDFGLAAEIRSSMMSVSETPMDMAGTRPYMAPEQWRGRLQDAKTDQYALAVTAYELIAGHLPFQTQDVGILRECVLHDEPELIPHIAEHINAAIRKAMSKRREDRFESCRVFVKAMAAKPKEPEEKQEVPLVIPPVSAASSPVLPAIKTPSTLPKRKFISLPFLSSLSHWRKTPPWHWIAGGGLAILGVFCLGMLISGGLFSKPAPSDTAALLQTNKVSDTSKPSADDTAALPQTNEVSNIPESDFQKINWIRDKNSWQLKNNIFTVTTSSHLISPKEYENFIIRFDFRLSEGTNNGFLVRTQSDGNPVNGGFEIQIRDDSTLPANSWAAEFTGSIWNILPAERGHLQPVGKWNAMEIVANGSKIKVILNNVTILDRDILSQNTQINKSSGYIGFTHISGTFDLRNVRIKELPAVQDAATILNSTHKNVQLDNPFAENDSSVVKPRIFSTFPLSGAKDVDANINEIVVTFDTEMNKAGMDWGISYYDSPPEAKFAKPYWKNSRTCALPLQALAPGYNYRVRLNHSSSGGFTSAKGVRLEPCEFLFTTRSLKIIPSSSLPSPSSNPATSTSQNSSRVAGDRQVLTINGVAYPFRWCPPGDFMMGCPENEVGRQTDSRSEKQHRVTLSRGFWFLETEVTQTMWESVRGNNPSSFKGTKLPVENISWNDCQEFIGKLNGLGIVPSGFKFSLPTEAQWEYACRAGTITPFYFGNTLDKNQANYGGESIKSVGSYSANAWGLYDMHGNVWEWCSDWEGDYPIVNVTDPTGPNSGHFRIFRGGSWSRRTPFECRSASRFGFGSWDRAGDVGFRLALIGDGKFSNSSSSLSSPSSESPAPGTNLVLNPSFETNQNDTPVNWQGRVSGGSLSLKSVHSSNSAHQGSRLVTMESMSGGSGAWSQVVKVEPFTRYQFSVWYKLDNVQPSGKDDAGFQIGLESFPSQPHVAPHSVLLWSKVFKGTCGWTKFEQTVTIGAADHAMLISLRFGKWENKWLQAKGTISIDDVQLIKLSSGTPSASTD